MFSIRFLCLVVLLCFFCNPISGQDKRIDSLLQALKTAGKDTARVTILNALANEFTATSIPDTALMYANRALPLAQKKQFKAGETEAYYQIGSACYDLGKYHEAVDALTKSKEGYAKIAKPAESEKLSFYQKKSDVYNLLGNTHYLLSDYTKAHDNYMQAMVIRKQLHDSAGIASSYNNFANIEAKKGDFTKALKNYFASLKIYELMHDEKGAAVTLNNIAPIYVAQENYEEAIRYLNKSLVISEKINYRELTLISCFNRGEQYLMLKEYALALKDANKTLELSTQIHNNHYKSVALSLIGKVYSVQGNYTAALQYNLDALKLIDSQGDAFVKSGIANNICEIYLLKGDVANAILYGEKALAIAEALNSVSLKEEISKNLNTAYQQKGDFRKAHEMLSLYFISRDSIVNEENKKSILEQQLQYDFEKKELKTKLQQEKTLSHFRIEAQKKNVMLIVVSSLLILLITGTYFWYRNYRQKHEIRELEKNELKQKLLLSQMNPHFIFNSINNIQGLIAHKKDEEAISYLTGFSALTRQILENSSQNYISLYEEMEMIENYLSIQQLLHNNSFSYALQIPESINREHYFIPPMLTQPFIENSIKHGLSSTNGFGKINVVFSLHQAVLTVEVTDNGTGFVEKEKTTHHKSLSMDITRQRLANYKQVSDATIYVDNLVDADGKVIGARVVFEVPYIYEN